ncbi:hypothetical protein PHISCL_06143 [Aspergillus sclerotialis]|uniref:Uncharacterized protein n=1 Tax=Aspergillus sclerotialis TaxID=2070753 RepID=A0A3A2ZFX6_9EURO|nr:hypothetical protein PHISCL_06143 [Aspergillus sclerotialis]
MDKSCDPYKETVLEGMKGAFKLAGAGSNTLNQLSRSSSTPAGMAQKDLLSYLFAETMTNGNIDTNNAQWNVAKNMFSSVLRYKTTSNTSNGEPRSTDGKYQFLPVNEVILYCDYSRFKGNEDCKGNSKKRDTCDTSIGVAFPMNDIYSNCKKDSIISSHTVIVSMSPN